MSRSVSTWSRYFTWTDSGCASQKSSNQYREESSSVTFSSPAKSIKRRSVPISVNPAFLRIAVANSCPHRQGFLVLSRLRSTVPRLTAVLRSRRKVSAPRCSRRSSPRSNCPTLSGGGSGTASTTKPSEAVWKAASASRGSEASRCRCEQPSRTVPLRSRQESTLDQSIPGSALQSWPPLSTWNLIP